MAKWHVASLRLASVLHLGHKRYVSLVDYVIIISTKSATPFQRGDFKPISTRPKDNLLGRLAQKN